jgi:hypothetical protein
VELAQPVPVAARRMARHAALGVASWAKLAARLAVRMTARTLTAMRRAARQMHAMVVADLIDREADGSEDCGAHYKLAAPRKAFYLVPICHAITDPPVTKIRLWASFGV